MAQPPFPGDYAPAEDLVLYYYRQFYTVNEICGFLLLCYNLILSHTTVKRILRRLHLRRTNGEEDIRSCNSNSFKVHRNGFKNMGYRTLWKYLNAYLGIRVTQTTIPTILNVVDPVGVRLRSHWRLCKTNWKSAAMY